MNKAYSDANLEKFLQKHFQIDIQIKKVIARDLSIGRSAEAFIFLDQKNRAYAFISAEAKLLMGDISKLLSKMSIKPAQFFPPDGNKEYFDYHALNKFLDVFPGRKHIQGEDLRFYKTLVPYNPALVEIAEIKNGIIKNFNPDSSGEWRTAVRYTYRKII